MQEPEVNFLPYITTAIVTIIISVGTLWYYGYLHFAKPQDALLLADYTMIKTVPGEDYKISANAAEQTAACIDGVLVLRDNTNPALTGVLVDNKKRAIHCLKTFE
ncbi:hypothetical protein AKN87_10635 [Thiopseudomonas alkaliphila]|uniref:Lipoprotein n=1 Tax=Thiopseudomonas alkaliphila TaxID=1697053 RepID=A0A0K1XFG1_9GAMM|nr:hypothetical protein [Thiopseudomonas alkaliphila]AKX45494.1 hypothetical protein AKN87_10635 [Thiopseudomonas alkaliphila]AKX46971.1 hypothetical protein AKN94_06075 [Thiopseudomonas alkaliphila]AKX48796.1 hypothetical protein AKN93_04805 [Thiopseudomonas alkaliphila]AKX50832.1 hypothetical protein AKN92_04480 [Thiopseudomonas alkaliphila]AKX53919.1 hypothetical protein AKN91_09765 [Thiopseudomonas alkaliphila]